jgi:hypothetical protein
MTPAAVAAACRREQAVTTESGRLRCADRYRRGPALARILLGMTTCSYCHQPATTTIIANPHEVCLEHALEFWTGLLAYARSRSGPCVKNEGQCTCPLCAEVGAEQLRDLAVASAAPPGDHEDFTIRLAS